MLLGTEGCGVKLTLGPLVDHTPLIPAKGPPINIMFDEILLDLGPDRFEDVSHVPDHRIVPEHGMLFLNDVIDPYDRDWDDHEI